MPTLLALVPHPDDESYAFAGTIALAARAGWRCVAWCASAGEGGKRHDGGPSGREALAEARIAELAASCRLLGVEACQCWRLPDGGLSAIALEQTPLAAALTALAPDVVLALGKDGAYGHPDHIAVYRWLEAAVEAMPGDRPGVLLAAFPPGLFLPQYENCIAMMGDPPTPAAGDIGASSCDVSIDIREVAAIKLGSMSAHRTQLPGGDPRALFPPGIVDALLDEECFSIAPYGTTDRAIALVRAIMMRSIVGWPRK